MRHKFILSRQDSSYFTISDSINRLAFHRFLFGGVDMQTKFQDQLAITRASDHIQFLWMLVLQAFRVPDSDATKDRVLRS